MREPVLTPAGFVEPVRIATLLPSRVDGGTLAVWYPAWWRPPLRLRWRAVVTDTGVFAVPLLERSICTVRRPSALLEHVDLLEAGDRRAIRELDPWTTPDGLGFHAPDSVWADVRPCVADRLIPL